MKKLILLLIVGCVFAEDDNSVIKTKSIICLKNNDAIPAAWNHRLNNNISEIVIIGKQTSNKPVNPNFDIGCLGRCGVGCGNNNGAGYYTQDCLNHDLCAFYDINFGGIFDRDCGDEMRKTIDDYILGKECYIDINDYN